MGYLRALALSALALVAPAKPLLVAALVLVGLDALTGVAAAWKRGERITSAGLRRTAVKALLYEVTILAAWVSETYLLGGTVPAAKLAAGWIGVTELQSVLENTGTVIGRPVFEALASRLGSTNDQAFRRANSDENSAPDGRK